MGSCRLLNYDLYSLVTLSILFKFILFDNLTEKAATEIHAPFGVPEVDFESNYCELVQNNYITGYSHDVNMPLFVSYTLKNRVSNVELN